MGIYAKYFKRLLDIVCAILAIVFLWWLYLLLALLVRVKLGSPVIFCQQRPGKKGADGREKIFNLYKFRTMTDQRGPDGELLSDEERLTRFGRRLRDWSLDELPEVWNILKGDMSVVGPRPLLVKYLPLYSREQRRRHDVRPGLTGWAQVNGRNSISWQEKFRLDVEYVDHISFAMDVKTVFLTVKKVLIHEGVNSGEHETMPDFEGNPEDGQQA